MKSDEIEITLLRSSIHFAGKVRNRLYPLLADGENNMRMHIGRQAQQLVQLIAKLDFYLRRVRIGF